MKKTIKILNDCKMAVYGNFISSFNAEIYAILRLADCYRQVYKKNKDNDKLKSKPL